MPAKRIHKSSLLALIASCLTFAPMPSFGQENDNAAPVKVSKRPTQSSPKDAGKKNTSVVNQGERVSLSKPNKTSGTRLRKPADTAVVPASSLDDSEPLRLGPNESVVVTEEPSPMVADESWAYPPSYERAGASYPGAPSSGTEVYIDTGILGSILSRTKVRVEGATFWGKGYILDPIITTGPATESIATVGQINGTNTTNLFGGTDVMENTSQGVRFSTDLSLDPSGTRGLLFRMFYASEIGESFTNVGGPEIVVTRPFFTPPTPTAATIVINHPTAAQGVDGTINAAVTSKVSGGDLLVRNTIGRDRYGAFDLLLGYQHMRLDEGLSVVSNTRQDGVPDDAVLDLADRFGTTNRFHGFAIGLDSMVRGGRWSFGSMFKLGMGNIEREIDIDGSRTIRVTDQNGNLLSTSTTADGLLARTSNNGTYRSDRFVVSPEVALTLGYRFSPRMDATFTYTYLGLPSVARVGEQIDPNLLVNLSNPPTGVVAPRFAEVNSNYSLHSLSYGIQWRY